MDVLNPHGREEFGMDAESLQVGGADDGLYSSYLDFMRKSRAAIAAVVADESVAKMLRREDSFLSPKKLQERIAAMSKYERAEYLRWMHAGYEFVRLAEGEELRRWFLRSA